MVRLGADLTGFDSGLARANAKLDDLDKAATKASRGWSAAFSSMQTVGMGLTAAITVPILGLGAASIAAFSDFQSSMNRVSALGDITGESLKRLKDQAIDLGAKTQFSAKQAADGMGELAAAGFNAEQIMKSMPAVLALAASGQLSVGQAAEIAANLMGGFKIPAEGIGRAVDVVAKAAASGSVTVQNLADTFRYVGPISTAAGLSFEEVSAAITLLSNAGLKGEQAGTGLRGMMGSLLDPSREAAAALDKLGVVATDSTGKLLPLENIIGQLGEKGATTKDIFKIFGRETASAVSALVNTGAPALRSMTVELTNSQGAAQKMAGVINQGVAGAFEKMRGSVETAAISLGESLGPTAVRIAGIVEDLANKAAGLSKWFAELPTPVQDTMLGFTALAVAAGPLLLALGTIGQSIVSVTNAAKLMSITMSGLMTAIPWVALAASIGLLIKGLYDYKAAVDNLKGAEKEQNDSLVELEIQLRQQGVNITELTNQYNHGEISQQAYTKALIGLAKAHGDAIPKTVELGKATKQAGVSMQSSTKEADKYAKALEDAEHVLGLSVKKTEDAEKAYALLFSAWQKGEIGLSELGKAYSELQKRQAAASKGISGEIAGWLALANAEAIQKKNMDLARQAIVDYMNAGEIGGKKIAAVALEVDALGRGMYGTALATQTLARDTMALTGKYPELQQAAVNAGNAIKGSVLETSAIMKSIGATSTADMRAEADRLATSYERIIALNRENKATTQDVKGAYEAWSDAERKAAGVSTTVRQEQKNALQEVSTIINDMSRDIAKSIIHWEGFGAVAKNVLESIGESILRNIIQHFLTSTKLVDKVIDGLGAILSHIPGLASIFESGATAAAGGAASAAGGAASAAGGAAGAAGQASGVVTSIGSSITGLVGAIGSVASAISGIIGNFQMMGMNKSLDLIEHEVRFSQLHLFNTLEKANEWWPKLSHLVDIWGAVNNVADELKYGITDRLNEINGYLQAFTMPQAPGMEFAGTGGGMQITIDMRGSTISDERSAERVADIMTRKLREVLR